MIQARRQVWVIGEDKQQARVISIQNNAMKLNLQEDNEGDMYCPQCLLKSSKF